jgi:hypothetical protein
MHRGNVFLSGDPDYHDSILLFILPSGPLSMMITLIPSPPRWCAFYADEPRVWMNGVGTRSFMRMMNTSQLPSRFARNGCPRLTESGNGG